MDILPGILDILEEASGEASKIIRLQFRKNLEYKLKTSSQDIVTDTDISSQKIIRQIISNKIAGLGININEVGFIEEESGTDTFKKYNFIIDPLDGTTNYSGGIPIAAVSIAFALNKEITLGLVNEPFSGRKYWAIKNEGAFLSDDIINHKKLVMPIKPVNKWLISGHYNGSEVYKEQFSMYEKIYPKILGLRNLGSLALDLCMLADGIFDVVLNRGCYLWDMAAASLIIKEAGGDLYTFEGKPLVFNWENFKMKCQVIACHPQILKQFLDLSG